jgi:hypothetical protein
MTSNTASASNLLQKKRKLEDEREALARKLDDLDAEITKTQAEYGELCNRSTPILALPVEVTCSIFRETFSTIIPVETKDPNHQMFELTEVDITHVCRQWRSVAISLPILWTTFYYFGSTASAATLDRFEVYLERSKTRLLELWFEFRGTDDREEALHRAAFEKAIMHVDRWRFLTVFSSSETEAKCSFNSEVLTLLKPLHAPNLEHFALYPDVPYEAYETMLHSSNTIQQNLQPGIFSEGAPKLRSVWMDTSTPVLYLPPLANVTTLRIEFGAESVDMIISISSFRALLAIPTLENVSFHEAICTNPASYHTELIHMNRLKHLRFGNELLCNMLPDIRAPLLETLVIHNGLIESDYYTDARRAGEPYTFPSLKSIALIDVTCENKATMWYFSRMTRNATQVTITQVDQDEAILQAIDDLPEKEEGFWPNLRTLTCDLETSYTEDVAVLLRIATCWDRYKRGLTLKIPMAQAAQWRAISPPHATYEMVSSLCTIEELVANDLRDQGPWPPGEEDTLDRRLDFYDADPFRIRIRGLAFHINYV